MARFNILLILLYLFVYVNLNNYGTIFGFFEPAEGRIGGKKILEREKERESEKTLHNSSINQ